MRFENRRKVRIYRIFLKLCTAAFALCFSVMGYSYYYKQIPNTIKIQAGKEETLNFGIPASATLYKDAVEVSQMDASNIPKDAIYFDLAQDVTFLANEQVDYNLDVKLFGMIPLKQVKVEVIQEKMLIPMGMPIGIYVKTDGILVVGTGNFTGNDGT